MSRAYVVRDFSQLMKKVRPPAEAKLMTFFGATDFNHECRKDFNTLVQGDVVSGILPLHDVPLSKELPIEMTSPPDLLAAELVTVNPLESKPAVLEDQRGQYPALTYEPMQEEPQEEMNPAEELETLLSILAATGIQVADVKELPSGAVRITIDDLLKPVKERTPEFVRVGGGYE